MSSVDLYFFQPQQQQKVCWLRHMLGESALQDTRGPSKGSFKLARSVHGHDIQNDGLSLSVRYQNKAHGPQQPEKRSRVLNLDARDYSES